MKPTVIFDSQVLCSDGKYRIWMDFEVKSLRFNNKGELDYVLLVVKNKPEILCPINRCSHSGNMMSLTIVFEQGLHSSASSTILNPVNTTSISFMPSPEAREIDKDYQINNHPRVRELEYRILQLEKELINTKINLGKKYDTEHPIEH